MSEAQTVWHEMRTRQSTAVTREWRGLMLAAVLLSAMCAAEVMFLNYVVGPDSVNMLMAAEGIYPDGD